MYLLKISTTRNKKRIPLISLLINWISARSAPQILSIRGECTFLLLNFLIIGFYNSSADSLFEIFSFLMPLSEIFNITHYKFSSKHYFFVFGTFKFLLSAFVYTLDNNAITMFYK